MLAADKRKNAIRNIKQAGMIANVMLAKNITDRKETDMEQFMTSMAEASTSIDQVKLSTTLNDSLASLSKSINKDPRHPNSYEEQYTDSKDENSITDRTFGEKAQNMRHRSQDMIKTSDRKNLHK